MWYRILTALKDYILEYLPKIKNEVRNNVNWLTDVYYHDIASSVITNGWVNDLRFSAGIHKPVELYF